MTDRNKILSKIEEYFFSLIDDTKLKNNLYSIRELSYSIWNFETPDVIKNFTDHGIDHSLRILDSLKNIFDGKISDNLNKEELFLLICGVYLHDIGMQCDLSLHSKVKDIAVNKYSAVFDIEINSSLSSELTYDEQKEIRKNHQFISAAWIHFLHQEKNINTSNKYILNIKKIDARYIPDLIDICQYHSKLDITNCDEESKFNNKIRTRYIASLLRFADELDITKNRINIDTIKIYKLTTKDDSIWWWHNITDINYDKNEIIIKITLSKNDFEKYNNNFFKKFITGFRTKNLYILNEINKHFNIIISNKSKCIENEFEEDIPNEVIYELFPEIIEKKESNLNDSQITITKKTESISNFNILYNENNKYENKVNKLISIPEKLALTFTLLNTNKVLKDKIAKSFDMEDIELSESCISYDFIGNDKYIKFKDHNFKNYLAARFLSRKKEKDIINIIFFKPNYIKIKPSMIEVVLYLLEIKSFNKILKIITDNEPEILLRLSKNDE